MNRISEVVAGEALIDELAHCRRRVSIQCLGRLLLCPLLAHAWVGCSGNGNAASGPESPPPPVSAPAPQAPPPPPTPPSSVEAWHGYFYGPVAIGDETYRGEALLTADGLIRIHFAAPWSEWGELAYPRESMQFVGNFERVGEQGIGAGIIIGQACSLPARSRFCAEQAFAEIAITTATRGLFSAEVQVAAQAADESWLLELAWPSETYLEPASLASVAGEYLEQLAEYAAATDVVMNADAAGQLFFQSPGSGCTGNAILVPHMDGAFSVYDVNLTIESCGAPYAHLNRDFHGLATHGGDLLMWLSTPDDTLPRAALTLWGDPHFRGWWDY